MKKLLSVYIAVLITLSCLSCKNASGSPEPVVSLGAKEAYTTYAANPNVDFAIYFILYKAGSIGSEENKYSTQYNEVCKVAEEEGYSGVNFLYTNFYYTGSPEGELFELQKLINPDINKALGDVEVDNVGTLGSRFPVLLLYKKGEAVDGVRGLGYDENKPSDYVAYSQVVKNLLDENGYVVKK